MASNFLNIPLLSDDFLARMLRMTDAQETRAPPTSPIPPVGDPAPAPAKPQTRCVVCRHKLQLADMPCRCGIRHCSAHRLPELHACTFDYKAHDRKVLETQVVRCVADKLKEERI